MSTSPTPFSKLKGVHPQLAELLKRRGMPTAFPVQEQVVPIAAEGKDVLVQSPTGSGKTLAFGLPIIDQIERETNRPKAVILAPTRELAVQIADDLAPLATGKQLRCVAVYGGAPIVKQAKAARDAAIIVATPGRLDDLVRSRKIDLREVSILVLDEADRMLDMGFQPQVDSIVKALGKGPRQTLLFSATLEGKVADIAASYTKDPEVVRTSTVPGAGGEIEHVVWRTNNGIKVDTILEILEQPRDLAVIFVRTKRGAQTLMQRLRTYGIRATALSGDMTQRERLREYERFQRGSCDVLVATDVFARGMDLDRITLVVNYDIPDDADTYQHRAGRTGRAGRSGMVITMLASGKHAAFRRMLKTAGVDKRAIDLARRTEKTGRKELEQDQWFVPQDKPKKKPYQKNSRSDKPEKRNRFNKEKSTNSNNKHSFKKKSGDKKPFNKKPRNAKGDGSIVSFNTKKGFGFISADCGGPDVFFHGNQLKDVDVKNLRKGIRVSYSVTRHERGPRADNVAIR